MQELVSFEKLLDTHKPDWWIVFATQQELIDCVRQCTDGQSGTVQAKLTLKREVLNRLVPVAKTAITWEQQIPTKSNGEV